MLFAEEKTELQVNEAVTYPAVGSSEEVIVILREQPCREREMGGARYGYHNPGSGVKEVPCVLLEVLKIEEEATVSADEELILLPADKVTHVTVDRQHPPGIGFTVIIFQVPYTQAHGQAAAEPPAIDGSYAKVVMREWGGYYSQSEPVCAFRQVVKSS